MAAIELPLTLLFSALWGIVAWLYGRYFLVPKLTLLGWVAAVLLLGIPGLLMMMLTMIRPVRVKCPQCAAYRPANDPLCPHCGAAFPASAPTGTEIFPQNEPLPAGAA